MQFKSLILITSQLAAVLAMERRANAVFTALKVYHTIIDESPYLVDATATVTWTESASISDTSLPTTAPTPTIGY